MFDVSKHTHQINLWISLSQFQPTYSASLAELNYECDVIEERVYIQDENETHVIHPDVVLTDSTEKRHSLVVDCKSKSIDDEQMQRYLKLNEDAEQLVIQGKIQNIDQADISSETVFSSFFDLSKKEVPNDIALVYFNLDPYSGLAIYTQDKNDKYNGNEFTDDRINNILPINLHPSQPLPTSHYPFDVYEADKESMVSSALGSIISLAMKEGEFSIEDILNRTHPYWNKLGDGKQDELKKRIKTIYLELLNAGLDEYLEKIAGTKGREWKRTSATIQAVHQKTDFYVDEVLQNLPQSRLDDPWTTDIDSTEDKSEADDD